MIPCAGIGFNPLHQNWHEGYINKKRGPINDVKTQILF